MVEIYTPVFTTSLTAAIATLTRPTTITVAATLSDFGATAALYSIGIFNAGTDANPVNFEALEVTAGGGTLSWTVTNEIGWNPLLHANGSTVVATLLTPRSIRQPLLDHTTIATIADPHTQYLQKGSFNTKGDLLAATGSGTFTTLGVGADGTSPVADSTQTTGIRWAVLSFASLMTHMGDLIVGGVLGAAQRLGAGTVGQSLTVTQNTATITSPVVGPTCSATGSGGLLSNGTNYDFAYAWATANPTPDGGVTLPSPITQFTATATGIVAVQAPAAPSAGLTLYVYANTHSAALRLQGQLTNASTGGTNTINVSSINTGSALTESVNTTGGVGLNWGSVSGTAGPPGAQGPQGAIGPAGLSLVTTPPYINIQDQKTSGSAPASITSGAFRTRTLNTITSNDQNLAVLNTTTNQILLPAGTYRCRISVPAITTNNHQARLQDVSNSGTLLIGTSEFSSTSTSVVTSSTISGRFGLAAPTLLEVQHRVQTTGVGGNAASFGTEVYTVAEFWLENVAIAPPGQQLTDTPQAIIFRRTAYQHLMYQQHSLNTPPQ